MLYLLVFLVCLCFSLVGTWYVRNFANAKGWTDVPKAARHVHSMPVPRLGGVAIYISFLTAAFVGMVVSRLLGIAPVLPTKPTLVLLGAGTIVFVLGLVDDLRTVSPYWKFGVQALAGIVLYAGGLGIHRFALLSHGSSLHWAYSIPLTLFWVLLITNAFNLIDGLDGLAAGSAVFSTFVVFVMSLIVPNGLVAFLSVALAGATLGFLRFNFHPATIFLGDSGSLFIGFVLAGLALAGSQKAPTMVAVGIPLVSLGFPILDVMLAVARRFMTGKPLFEADKHHIHHKLLRRGLSQRQTVLILYAVTAGFGFLSLVLLQDRRTVALVLALIGVGVLLGVQQLRYQEFAEMVSVLQRFGRRRQVLANHVAIRHATEQLEHCDDVHSICAVLRETFEPIGFDAIRLERAEASGFPDTAILPMRRTQEGDMIFSWSAERQREPSWELRLEIMTGSKNRIGHFALIRGYSKGALSLDVNMLTDGFQTSLSDAVARVFQREGISGSLRRVTG
ncbi:MAG TPA: MraY family glycosyltransferase [Candidatus Acidoferrum sp.]|nr:MraY family glycosyltransferase [Candidatus Acidoferrum sp.]